MGLVSSVRYRSGREEFGEGKWRCRSGLSTSRSSASWPPRPAGFFSASSDAQQHSRSVEPLGFLPAADLAACQRNGQCGCGLGLRPSRADPHPAEDQDNPRGCHEEHRLRRQLAYPTKSACKHATTLSHHQTNLILNSMVVVERSASFLCKTI